MKNIAIIIGVSEYNAAEDLPGCVQDVEIMKKLLCATGKYKVLQLDGASSKHDIIKMMEQFLLDEKTEDGWRNIVLFFWTWVSK